MKVAVIGGGSSYTPELIGGFLAHSSSLPLTELWLMDIAADRLAIVGGLAQRMVAAAGATFDVHLTADRQKAITGADYVITQLRVGGVAARREDEYLGLRHALIGQETTGIGGLAKALRTIPIILDIAGDIQRWAPGALLINFTNPAGLVTEALARHAPQVRSVGVCNAPITTQMGIRDGLADRLGTRIDRERTRLDTLGLNHLSWHRGFYLDGDDVWPDVLSAYISTLRQAEHPAWDPSLIETLGMIPNYYLQYYYHTARKLIEQTAWPPSRAEQVMAIDDALLTEYAEPDRTTPPPGLMQRGGAYYATVATALINDHYNDTGAVHVVNVTHAGAVEGWPADWVLELPCRVERAGIVPLPAAPLPPVCFGLLAQVKSFELLAVATAVSGDRDLAYQALLTHPLGPAGDRILPVLNDLLQTNQAFLPRFFPSVGA